MNAKELLAAATPLPWRWVASDYSVDLGTLEAGEYENVLVGDETVWLQGEPADTSLIVYAVNRLPDYEAAVDALAQLVAEADVYREDETTPDCHLSSGPYCGAHSFLEYSALVDEAREVLARLRGTP